MNVIKLAIDFILHIDDHLAFIVTQYGALSYIVLFLIIFAETGFVVTPFLPGDSLLFAAGAIAATSSLNIFGLWLLLFMAAFLGDTVNYWIGHFIGPKVFERENRFLKKEHLIKAQVFYDKHGGAAIVLARFVPIVRTFAPFVAGVARMTYPHFIMYNIIGGLIWVSLFTFAGYFFGNLPFVQHNFHYVVVVIVFLSLIPIIFEWYKAKKEAKHLKNLKKEI
jgi:membrane-associated protein